MFGTETEKEIAGRRTGAELPVSGGIAVNQPSLRLWSLTYLSRREESATEFNRIKEVVTFSAENRSARDEWRQGA